MMIYFPTDMKYLGAKTLAIASLVLVAFSISSMNSYAWHWTRGPFVDCFHIRWEIQNIENKPASFTASVISPESFAYSTSATVAAGEWGVLDRQFSNLNGNVRVRATISMGPDSREIMRDLICGIAASPLASGSTPRPSTGPSSTPYATATPYSSPSPTTGTSYLTTPATGISMFYLISLFVLAPLGVLLVKKTRRHKHLTKRHK